MNIQNNPSLFLFDKWNVHSLKEVTELLNKAEWLSRPKTETNSLLKYTQKFCISD